MRLIQNILKTPIQDYILIFNLYILLLKCKWIIFNRTLQWIGKWISTDIKKLKYTQEDFDQIIKVARYTKTLSKYVPFRSLCYDRALTVKKMLNSKNIYTEIHYGINVSKKPLNGHVWIIANNMLVIGEEVSHKFKSVRYFS